MRIQLRTICLAVLVTTCLQMSAQQRCGTNALLADREARFAEFEPSKLRHEAAYREAIAQLQQGRIAGTGQERVIPTVVHLIQLSDFPAISDARVHSQIDVLNEDYRLRNADSAVIPLEFRGVAADCNIRFCLASIDPNGCPTTGINRIVNPALANHNSGDEAQLKALAQWDPHRYLNVWVPVTITDGLLGYATFPDWLGFDPGSDGVVINGTAFGRGFGTPTGSYNLGRTTTHEVGHWLGLYHTFDGGCAGNTPQSCLNQGDQVCDTPPAVNPTFGCPGTQNTCTETPIDANDQTMNYMDYTDDRCMQMFTFGQKDRIDYYLTGDRQLLTSPANLTATGCDGTVSAGCQPIAAISSTSAAVCVGQAIQFQDNSYGPPSSWNWTFPSGTPGSSVQPNQTVTWSQPGTYLVTLVVGNTIGNDTISYTVQVSAASTAPITEGFESGAGLPAGWSETSESSQFHWVTSTAAASLGTQSVKASNFGLAMTGLHLDLISAPYDLGTISAGILTFDHAYKRKGSFNRDSLQVLISTDCGDTWQKIWEKSGLSLATASGFQASSPFVPTANQWKTDSLDLTPYLGNPEIKLKFRMIGDNGQDLYLDNINLSAPVNVITTVDRAPQLRIFPNPSAIRPTIRLELARAMMVGATLLDVHGKPQYNWAAERMSAGAGELELEESIWGKLPSGLYFLRVGNEWGTTTAKLVKIQ